MATSPNPYDQFDQVNPYDQFDATPASAIAQPSQYDPTTPYDAQLGAMHPVTAEIKQGLGNLAIGAGAQVTDWGQRLHQMYNMIMGGVGYPTESMDAEVQEKRGLDAAINNTYGGKLGSAFASVPAAIIAGPTIPANAALGGLLGLMQPTTANDIGGHLGASALNTGVGAAIAGATSAVANGVANWATNRAAEPFMGWTPKTANRVAAESVGSPAAKLDQPALADVERNFSNIFSAARSPNVTNQLGGDTAQAVASVSQKLRGASLDSFTSSAGVSDLMGLMRRGTATSEELGDVTSTLGGEAKDLVTSKVAADRRAGRALFDLQDHVDDLIGASIQDPALANAYQTAMRQYRNFKKITANPSILNSATGDVNMTVLARRLQRTDKAGYMMGGNTSDLYNAARWGQATGGGGKAPPFLQDLTLPWWQYQAINNPASRAIGGAVSNTLAPIAPGISYGLSGLGVGTVPIAVPYLEQ